MAFSEQLVILGIALGSIFGAIIFCGFCCWCCNALCCKEKSLGSTGLDMMGTPSKYSVKRPRHNKYRHNRHRNNSYSCSADYDIEDGNAGNYDVTKEDDCCNEDNDCCNDGGGDDGGGCDSGCGGGDDS